ncbi:flagellar basal body P-ring formation chaperone FlgA [Microbulbifer sp. HZ11]|uniref:flagellar basal body P-ring formation chaperone FlgA n=1 Tax=unclassified Microbulbifer TaxID=2619833 RepID=UPI00350F6B06
MLPLLVLLSATDQVEGAYKEQKLQRIAQNFLSRQSKHLGERVEIQVQQSAARWNHCQTPSAFLPANHEVRWGRVTVGIRCANAPHTRYLQASIRAFGHYWVPSENVPAGTELSAPLLKRVEGELSALPKGTLRKRSEIVGQIASRFLPSGYAIQRHQLKTRPLVNRRQPVTLIASGRGFHIAREGHAMDDGAEGDKVRVRLSSRKVVSGFVTGPGLVSIHQTTMQ